jgi:cell division protein FtsI/penicillin-binding protein 2
MFQALQAQGVQLQQLQGQQQQAQEQQMMKQLQMRNMVADVTEKEMAVNETKFNAELKKQQARKTAAETGAVMGGG